MSDEERRRLLADRPVQPITINWSELGETIDIRGRLLTRYGAVRSPVGEMVACWNEMGLAWLRLLPDGANLAEAARAAGRPLAGQEEPPRWLAEAVGEVTPVPVDLTSVTTFQESVLRAAREVPRGQTRSYAWLAQRIGSPRAVRAVGSALARNPVPLVVPCHRVVPSSGGIGQYIFGTAAKRSLLEWEAAG